jgi:hypothetical protein
MAKQMLAVEVLSEIECRVAEEIAMIDAKQGGITEQQRETLYHAYFSHVGRAMMKKYRNQGYVIKGASNLGVALDIARMNLSSRIGEIDSGVHVDVPQISDNNIASALSKEYIGGMSVVGSHAGFSAEDFAFGIAPSGGRFIETPTGLDMDKVRRIANREFNGQSKTPEAIMATIPRKYDVVRQSYELDVKRTMQEGGIDANHPAYHTVIRMLESERDDPIKRDELLKMHAQFEFRDDSVPEVDDE